MSDVTLTNLIRRVIYSLMGEPEGLPQLDKARQVSVANSRPVFFSAVIVGTGAPQLIPHGLGALPTGAMFACVNDAGAPFAIVPGVHTGTDLQVTVTAGASFMAYASA